MLLSYDDATNVNEEGGLWTEFLRVEEELGKALKAEAAARATDAAREAARAEAAREQQRIADEMADAMGYGEPDVRYTEVTDQIACTPGSESPLTAQQWAVEDGGGAGGYC